MSEEENTCLDDGTVSSDVNEEAQQCLEVGAFPLYACPVGFVLGFLPVIALLNLDVATTNKRLRVIFLHALASERWVFPALQRYTFTAREGGLSVLKRLKEASLLFLWVLWV